MISDAAAEDKIRPTTRIGKFGAIAIIPLPIIKTNNVHNKTGRTENRFVSLTKIGPQIANVRAYIVTSCPRPLLKHEDLDSSNS